MELSKIWHLLQPIPEDHVLLDGSFEPGADLIESVLSVIYGRNMKRVR
jgi:hypothetical protein